VLLLGITFSNKSREHEHTTSAFLPYFIDLFDFYFLVFYYPEEKVNLKLLSSLEVISAPKIIRWNMLKKGICLKKQ